MDTSVWARCDAECSPERGFYHHPSRHSAGQPIVAGWSYSWLAQLSLSKDSWTAPLDVRRVPATDNPHSTAVAQIQDHVATLPGEVVPTYVLDAGYDPVRLARELGELDGERVAVLVRLRRDRCFYADPPTPTGPKVGRPGRHGAKFACRDATTWPEPTAAYAVDDAQYGQVQVRAWSGLHAKTQNHPERGANRTKPVVRGWVLLVEVSRLPGQTHVPRQLWLWWRGPGQPDLALLWRAYVRRFDLEHTFRFAKQTLNWTTPRVRHPEQADRWTWLVLLAYTELRLARSVVADQRLPWEAIQHGRRSGLTPARVRQGFLELRAWLGTPASPPKPCGRSPGRPKGTHTGPAPRCPAHKKTA